jgi:hypothetical protein
VPGDVRECLAKMGRAVSRADDDRDSRHRS